jgi:hypothetical protein
MQNLKPQVIILISIIFFSSCFDSSTSTNCSLYKEGAFYFHVNDGKRVVHYTITRKGPDQIEKSEENGDISKYKILWTDSCSYDLIFIEGTENLPKEILDLKRKMVVHTNIILGTSKYFLFKSTSNLDDHVLKDTIWLTR